MGNCMEGFHFDICREVKVYKPPTMIAAISFARLEEEKIN